MENLAPWVLTVGCFSALCTGLGALPALWLPHTASRARGLAAAVAAGMMLTVSLVSLAGQGISLGAVAGRHTVLGMLLGGLFVYGVQGRVQRNGRRGALLFLVMLLHSVPEGIALGVGFASDESDFGELVALAISVHNIPEGVAISLALAADGAGFWRCCGMSVLSSLPQPLLAVPAFLAAWWFRPLLPIGLGLAAGAMMFLVVAELLPQALAESGPTRSAAGVLLGSLVILGASL